MAKQLISRGSTWKTLKNLSSPPLSLRKLFTQEPDRAFRMTFNAVNWDVDFSRQLLDGERMKLLLHLVHECGLEKAKADMFRGEIVNRTERRSVLHTALRALPSAGLTVDGQNVTADVRHEIEKMEKYTENVISGKATGYSGKKFKYVVAIGIGGSNLGPEMAVKALQDYGTGLDVRFVSNVDPADLFIALKGVTAEETLFIISSKTFTTTETMQNATAAREWFLSKTGSSDSVSRHFIAVSTNRDLVKQFGILEENMFVFWDWVGGRYSMTSAIGLPIMLAIGPANFGEMLDGFREMDIHYREQPPEANAPILMALVNLWNTSFLGFQTHAVVAYDEYLDLLPDHLQQLVMESLGKRVTEEGLPLDYPSCPVFFGGAGTNVQHSYFQLLHQGSGVSVPVDFIGFATSLHPIGHMHKDLFLNMVAQANVMAFGETEDELRGMGNQEDIIPHKVIPGGKPSTILVCEKLTPKTLGQLISLYENMVHAWGVLLGIDAFDQFGVEAGKRVAKALGKALPGELTMENALTLMKHNGSK